MGKRFRTFMIWFGLIAGVIIIVGLQQDDSRRREQAQAELDSLELDPDGDLSADEYMSLYLELEREARGGSNSLSEYLPLLLGVGVVVLVVIFFLKKMGQQQGGNIFELRKTRARQLETETKTTFADVGGLEEAIESLQDLVVYLKDPSAWKNTGARAPRGILLTGPPGTGKTLLARALAGETDSAFFYTSATEFVEMFVGVGAARVRDTFENASKEDSAIIFVDELDAIGRQRSSGVGIMHEEREQTLNQLLVLMDGLERNPHVIVLAATNRADVLDPALTRPGRFDRMLQIDAPDAAGRKKILEIHSRDKTLAEDVDLAQLAERTASFTGADLEALMNEAAVNAMRRAARNSEESIDIRSTDLDKAIRELRGSESRFDRLDAVLVESVTQLAEPTGRAVARVTMATGQVLEGDVLWMNTTHIKLQSEDGSQCLVSREHAAIIEALEGTELAGDDVAPDRWVKNQVDTR